MRRAFALALGVVLALVSGCAASQSRRSVEPYALLLPSQEPGPDRLPENTWVIKAEPPLEDASVHSIEPRLMRARRLYRDLAFRASLDELARAQEALEAHLGSAEAYDLLDRVFLLRGLDELALGDLVQARVALRQAASLRPQRTSLDPAEFSPDVRTEYEQVRRALANEAGFPLEADTEPPGAELTLDGREVGRTPLSVRLHRGRHYLVFRAPDRLTQRRIVDVDRQPPSALHVDLETLSPAQVAGRFADLDAAAFAALDNATRADLVPLADGATPVHIGGRAKGWAAALLDPSTGDIRLTATAPTPSLKLAVPELVYSLRDVQQPKPLVRKWWFWTVIGVAAVAASLGLYFGLRHEPEPQLVISRQSP